VYSCGIEEQDEEKVELELMAMESYLFYLCCDSKWFSVYLMVAEMAFVII
jgi:hypothetical protein